MKHLLQHTILLLFAGIIFYVSCKKEYSCENCGEGNKPPVANAGKDTSIILPADSIMLDGSKSTDPDDGIASYKWAKIAGPDTFNIISSSTIKTGANKLVKAAYQFQLTVTDKGGLSAMDTMLVTVYPAGTTNRPPIANAGSDTTLLLPANAVTLDGSGSTDPENNIVSYLWTKISGPASLNILSANTIQTPVTSLVQGIYLFELKVTDTGGLMSTDTVRVMVIPFIVNRPPVSKAGKDTIIFLPINNVTLDGSGSTDPDNNISDYIWTKFSGPASFNISNANAVQIPVSDLVEGVYLFELKVTDAGGLFSKDTVQVTVAAAIVACNNSNRPIVNAQLVPFGTLSKPRVQIAVAAAGTKILFAGGRWTPDCPDCWGSSRVDIYDTVTHQWSIAELSQGRWGIAAVAVGTKIFFAGGEVGDGAFNTIYDAVDIYDASTNTWSVSTLSEPRSYIMAATVGNKVFFAGGWQEETRFVPPTSKVDIYDLSTNSWSTAALSEPRAFGSAVTVNQKIYFAGGLKNGGNPSNRIDVYDNVSHTWSVSTLNTPMANLAGITSAGKIYWAAGCDVEIKNANTGSSSADNLFRPGVWSIDDGHNAVLKDNEIVFFRHQGPKNKFDIYNTITNTWSIGVLQQYDTEYSSIISVNNTIYVAGGWESSQSRKQVWKLGF